MKNDPIMDKLDELIAECPDGWAIMDDERDRLYSWLESYFDAHGDFPDELVLERNP